LQNFGVKKLYYNFGNMFCSNTEIREHIFFKRILLMDEGNFFLKLISISPRGYHPPSSRNWYGLLGMFIIEIYNS
jgi:hypothetical protein